MANVDLRELLIERSPLPGHGRPRRIVVRLIMPAVIVLSFAAVFFWSLQDRLWPAVRITTVAVVASRSTDVAAAQPLFQAAGWIEPRPQPTVVSALIEGIVDEILVVEGETVKTGQTVARLFRRDAEIALDRVEAMVALRQAEVDSAKAALMAAENLFVEPLPLLAGLAESEAALAKVETELARLPALVRGAEAKRDYSEKDVAGKSQATGAVPAIAIQRAKSDLESAHAVLDDYRQQMTTLEKERRALSKRSEVIQRQLELKIDETRRVAEAKAQIQVAQSQLNQSKADRDLAKLHLDRTDVRARANGHVLALVARPGSRLMGIDRAATQDASTVLTMFDPTRLQVRTDVRLEDVPRVFVGQRVRIETAAHSKTLSGHVLMATAMTDIQKNTLQVKVAIDSPVEVLKPDMLTQVTFLAEEHATETVGQATVKLRVPKELVQGTGSEARIWIVDQAAGKARLRSITVGPTAPDGLVEVISGLKVGDRLINDGRQSVVEGQRVNVVDGGRTVKSIGH